MSSKCAGFLIRVSPSHPSGVSTCMLQEAVGSPRPLGGALGGGAAGAGGCVWPR